MASQSTKPTTSKAFHVVAKNSVGSIFVISTNSGNIESKMMKQEIDNKRFFQGIYFTNPVRLLVLGNKKRAPYRNINEICSISINANLLKSMKESGSNVIRNSIVVNTPLEAREVFIKFPVPLRRLIALPEYIRLKRINISEDQAPTFKRAGFEISQNIKNWHTIVDMGICESILKNDDSIESFLTQISIIPIDILCYFCSSQQDIIVD